MYTIAHTALIHNLLSATSDINLATKYNSLKIYIATFTTSTKYNTLEKFVVFFKAIVHSAHVQQPLF